MSGQSSNYEVGLGITVVPDGFAPDGRCRLSLQVMPYPKTRGEGERRVDLSRWPLEIARLAKTVRIAGGHLDVSHTAAGVKPAAYLPTPVPSDLSNSSRPEDDPIVVEAQKLWTTIFTTGEDDGFKRLKDALAGTVSDALPTAAAASTPAVPREVV